MFVFNAFNSCSLLHVLNEHVNGSEVLYDAWRGIPLLDVLNIN